MNKRIPIIIYLLTVILLVSCDGNNNSITPKNEIAAESSTNIAGSWSDNKKDNKKIELESAKLIEHGTVDFHIKESDRDVKLPLFGIAATYGISNTTEPAAFPSEPLPDVTYTIPDDQQDLLAVYWVNTGGDGEFGIMLLGPIGWRPVRADVGADASMVISLENPDDSNEKITYYDTSGGCQGCAISSIGAYFPSLRKWAEDQGFTGEDVKFDSQTLLTPQIMAYTKESSNKSYKINGVAYQQHEEGDAWFRNLEMSNTDSMVSLVTTILDFFIKQYDLVESNEQ